MVYFFVVITSDKVFVVKCADILSADWKADLPSKLVLAYLLSMDQITLNIFIWNAYLVSQPESHSGLPTRYTASPKIVW
jgi:hypothetical protein